MAKAGVMTTLTTFHSTTQERARQAVLAGQKTVKVKVQTKTLTDKQIERVYSTLKREFEKEHDPTLTGANGTLTVYNASKEARSASEDDSAIRDLIGKIREFCPIESIAMTYVKSNNESFEISLAWFDKTKEQLRQRSNWWQ